MHWLCASIALPARPDRPDLFGDEPPQAASAAAHASPEIAIGTTPRVSVRFIIR
jgi:hypothetical protein